MRTTSDTFNHCSECGVALTTAALGGVCPKCLARAVVAPEEDDAGESLPRMFGEYELLERIAQGGMGVVYRARQVSLRRMVAVKMLLAGEFATREFVQRFRGEAAAAAVLQHPNIVAIHEVGARDGQHFFSMDFVAGRNLAEVVGPMPLPAERAARYVRAIAGAIHFAHERGILHRDLKPSNVLIDETDQPRVTDFGLAKRLDQSADLTLTGQVLGSPHFMPPEQAGTTGIKTGPHSDVYSLGAILYHTLTARPPFLGETLHQVLQQTIEAEPVSPRRLNPAVPPDLETICLKCLAKEPSRRYASAQELADELGRFLAGEPIRARPLSTLGRAWRWCRRKPAQAAILAALAGAILTGFIGITSQWRRAEAHAAAQQRQRERAERAEAEAREKLWSAYLAQARAGRRSGQAGSRVESLRVLGLAARAKPSLELRNEAIACLALADLQFVKSLPATPVPETFAAYDGEHDRYAVTDRGGNIRVCRVADEQELFALPAATPPPVTILFAFSPDGAYLPAMYADGRLAVWRVDERRVAFLIEPGLRKGLAFTDDSRRLAVAMQDDRAVALYDVTTGQRKGAFKTGIVPWELRWNPDLRRLAVLSMLTNVVEIFDADTGERVSTLHAPGKVYDGAWAAEGRSFVTACQGLLHLSAWDSRSGQFRFTFAPLQATPDGLVSHLARGLLASRSQDGTTRLWDFATGEQHASVPANGIDLRFSRDGRRLSFFSRSRSQLQLYEVFSRRACRTLGRGELDGEQGPRGPHTYWSVHFSPDEQLLAAGSQEGIRCWDAASGELLAALPIGNAHSVFFHPEGRHLIASGNPGLFRWTYEWDATRRQLRLGAGETLAPPNAYGRACVTPTGELIAYLHDQQLHLLSPATNRTLVTDTPLLNRVALSPNGQWVAAIPYATESQGTLWDAASGHIVRRFPTTANTDLAFTPDNRWLITGEPDGFYFRDPRTGQEARRLAREHTAPFHGPLAFSPDGTLLALARSPTVVHLFAYPACQELASFEAPDATTISWLCFNRSNSQLAVAGEDRRIHVWDLRWIRRELAAMNLDWTEPATP